MTIATVFWGAGTGQAIAGSHYESYKTVNCLTPVVTVCAISFPAVPAGKILTVTRISCTMSYSSGPPRLAYFQFGHATPMATTVTDKGSSPFTFLSLTPRSDSPTNTGYTANLELNQVFTAGQAPYLYQSLTAGKFNMFNCSIFGTMDSSVT